MVFVDDVYMFIFILFIYLFFFVCFFVYVVFCVFISVFNKNYVFFLNNKKNKPKPCCLNISSLLAIGII